MGSFTLLLYAVLLISEVKCIKSDNITKTISNKCVDDFRDVNGYKINITHHCQDTHCIAKCCRAMDRMFYQESGKKASCINISVIESKTGSLINTDYFYSKIGIYKSHIEKEVMKSNRSLISYKFVMNKKMSYRDCASGIPTPHPIENFYLLENGSLVLENPNFYHRFAHSWAFGNFCMDHFVEVTEKGVKKPILIYRYMDPPSPAEETKNTTTDILKAVALLVSSFSLLLVVSVYGVIRELRNLVGMILMAYVGTLAVAFFIQAVELLGVYSGALSSAVCKPMSVFLYYTILSSFFWMNVMSLDIWWTFRGMYKARPIHRRGELVKFGYYAVYACGVPLIVAIAVAVIDYSDLKRYPHIFKPHFEFCFYMKEGQEEMKHYLYIPILILLVFDWIFFLMTAFNIWRIRRSMAQFANDASKYNNNQNRFGLYLKLSLVMGVSWIFEVVSLPWWMQTIGTVYNSLVGVAIFFIFVFKRKILYMLCKRFSIKNRLVEEMQRQYSRSVSVTASSDRKRSGIELSVTDDRIHTQRPEIDF